MLVHARRIIGAAWRRHQAVVAFNTINAETTLAIARGASAVGAPTLYEISEKTIEYLGLKTVVAMVTSISDERSVKVPLAMHLDHGHSFTIAAQAIQAGFTSVMIDASALPFKENVALTRRVVTLGHKRGVLVQGELGALKPAQSVKHLRAATELMTDPIQAREFVRLTGVDTLAVAVGTLHGPAKIFQRLPKIDFKRLHAIHQLVRVPLVLHGASGVPGKDLRQARRFGVTVINIDTELRLAYLDCLRRELKRQPKEYDPRVVFAPVVAGLESVVVHKLKELGYSV